MTDPVTTFDLTFADIPEGKHAMAIMGKPGDTKVIWDPDSPDEVNAVRTQFDALVRTKRYKAFRVDGKYGERGEQMDQFDPEAGRIIFVPPMQGG
jgi:hypothetical protein